MYRTSSFCRRPTFETSSMEHKATRLYEPRLANSNNVFNVTSKGPDQPAHMHSLIRSFASHLNMPWEFLSLKRGGTGSTESTLVQMPHCWKSHIAAYIVLTRYAVFHAGPSLFEIELVMGAPIYK